MAFSVQVAALASLLLPGRSPQDAIRARVLAFYRDDRAHRWPDVLDHFSVGIDASLTELTERQLLDLFHQSQPAWTSPEGGYGAR